MYFHEKLNNRFNIRLMQGFYFHFLITQSYDRGRIPYFQGYWNHVNNECYNAAETFV